MEHVVTEGEPRRRSSSFNPPSTKPFRFPDFQATSEEAIHETDREETDASRSASPAPLLNGLPQGMHSVRRWPARPGLTRNDSSLRNWISWAGGARRSRQKSLGEAIKTVRTRKASVSENAHEIAESLKAPVSLRLVILCGIWYATSIITNTSSKAILTAFPKPVTLTVIQFLLVSFWCIFLSFVAKHSPTLREAMPVLKNGIRRPSRDIIVATLPLTAFQVGGHILNSDAMTKIPVSLVHTIKGLSPLMTVVAYRVFFNIKHSTPTYLSLIPLTCGVIMACSASFAGNFVGLTYAFGSAVLFVTQNIVSKKIFNEAAKAEADGTPYALRKPDKLNLLCYSSGCAFLITFPIWLWSEGFGIAADFAHDWSIDLRERPGSLDHGALAVEYIFNGSFHFGQSLVAFILLGLVSPVTYSVAALLKRVVVIMFAIVWFGNPMTGIQGLGFAMTFLGLYLYDRTSDAAKAEKRARERAAHRDHLLPLNLSDAAKKHPAVATTAGTSSAFMASPTKTSFSSNPANTANEYINGDPTRPLNGGIHHHSHYLNHHANNTTNANGTPISLPIGTRAEDTWTANDMKPGSAAAEPTANGAGANSVR